MNNIDLQYKELIEHIIHFGVEKKDRTGTGTKSIFGWQIRHNMKDGFPLLTTKKMAWKTMVTELLWFLRGDTNIKYLVDNDCHIWDGDAFKNWVLKNSEPDQYWLSQEQFIERIKTDDEFAKEWGELGPIYGKQWRSWSKSVNKLLYPEFQPIDQIANLISELKTNPDSRRLMVSAWNVGELDQMVLPPCHYGFQVYTRELSDEERLDWMKKNRPKTILPMRDPNVEFSMDEFFRPYGVPKRAISLMWNQRSVDTFLGLPFNIASYGLLLEIIAKEVNMIPEELIGNLGDVHLYLNHIEQAKEQIGRDLSVEERMDWWFENKKPNRDVCDHIDVQTDYAKDVYFDSIGVPKRTREPFNLPSVTITERNWYMHEAVKEKMGEKTFNEKILSFTPDCFELIDYQSHPKIKAPLSN